MCVVDSKSEIVHRLYNGLSTCSDKNPLPFHYSFHENGLQKYKARNQEWSATLADIHTIGNLITGPVYKQGCRLN